MIHTGNSMTKRLVFCLVVFLFLLFVFLLSLPMVLSTTTGTAWLSKKVGAQFGAELQIKQVELGWFGPQQLQGIELKKPQENLDFSCQEVHTEVSLWSLIFRRDVGRLTLKNPHLRLSKAFRPAALKKVPSLRAAGLVPQLEMTLSQLDTSFKGLMLVQEGLITFDAPDLDPLYFEQISHALDLTKKGEAKVDLRCVTSQKGQQGTIALQGSVGSLSSAFPSFSLDATLSALPTRGLDQLLSLAEPACSGLVYNLLGPTADIQCHFGMQQDLLDLDCKLSSPQCTALISTTSADGKLSLREPLTVHCELTPSLMNTLARFQPALKVLKLQAPTFVDLHITTLSSAFPLSKVHLADSAVVGTLQLSPQTTALLNEKLLVINYLTVEIESTSLQTQLNVKGNSDLTFQGQKGAVSLEGNLSSCFSEKREGDMTLNVSQFPLEIFDALGLSLVDVLGASVNLTASIHLGAQGNVHFAWSSPQLNIPSIDLSLNPFVTLSAPVNFSYTLSPALKEISKSLCSEIGPLQGSIQSFSLPNREVNLEMQAQLSDLVLEEPFQEKIPFLHVSLSIKSLNAISLQLQSNTLSAKAQGSFDLSKAEFSLLSPLEVHYSLTPASFPTLAAPTALQLQVEPFLFSFDRSTQHPVQGKLFCDQTFLKANNAKIQLDNAILPFEWNPKTQILKVEVGAQTQQENASTGSLFGQLSFKPAPKEKTLNLSTLTAQGQLTAQNLSSSLLDLVFDKPYLSVFVGPIFNANLKLKSTLAEQEIACLWTSANLNVNASFLCTKNALTLQGNTNQIVWTMTPEAFSQLDKLITGSKELPFSLKDAASFTLSLSKFTLPMTSIEERLLITDRIPSFINDLSKLELIATGSVPSLHCIENLSKEAIQLSSFTFSIEKGLSQTPLQLALSCNVMTQQGTTSKSGSLSIQSSLDPQGNKEMAALSGKLSVKAEQFPSRALDLFARTSGRTDFPFTTLLGNTFKLSLDTELSSFTGPLSCHLSSPVTQMELDGHFINGALLLKTPFYAQTQLSKETSRLFLKEINPLGLSYFYSAAPITMRIPDTGFYLPIAPYTAEKIAIPDATIELGKISCRNEGNVNIALGLLKSRQFDKNGELSLWFAPIDFSIKQGLVNVERTEILIADTFDICIWGTVDLPKDYVNMTLGLTAPTLDKAFGIKKLPDNYLLTIPMKGPADDVKINTSKATAKVALLLAWQNKALSGAFGGGPAGAIAGELLGAIATLPDGNAKNPPPKHPFPWEIGQEKKPSAPKKKAFKTSDKPLKQLFKVIR